MGDNRTSKYWNLALLLKPSQIDSNVPKALKYLAWKRTKRANGTIKYTVRTWKEWGLSASYINRFGTPLKYVNATWNGQNVGTRWGVKLRLELDIDNPDAMAQTRYALLNRKDAIAFHQENK
jgi:hypothetical protein